MQSEDEEPTVSVINGNSNMVVLNNQEIEDLEDCDIQETVEMVKLSGNFKWTCVNNTDKFFSG